MNESQAFTEQLIHDAQHILNGRQRGRAARLERLSAAMIPLDPVGLRDWLAGARDKQHEHAGGLFHACTARITSGVDPHLPTSGRYGCRLQRVPLVGHEYTTDDGERMFAVYYGVVGPGFMAPRFLVADDYGTLDAAIAACRADLLAHDNCFESRERAAAAVGVMLAERVAEAERRRAARNR